MDVVRPGFVYVVRMWVRGGFNPLVYFKIGQAADPRRRLGELQTGNPCELDLFAVFPVEDMDAIESSFHEVFNSLCVRGEWFKFGPNEEGFIRWLRDKFYEGTKLRQASTMSRDFADCIPSEFEGYKTLEMISRAEMSEQWKLLTGFFGCGGRA